MNSPGIFRSIVLGFALALSACGGGGDDDAGGAAGAQPAPTGIGAAGGTVLGPNGSKVAVPSGALAVATQIAVDQTAASAPPLPAGLTPIGQMFAFTPHGTTFSVPVTITMPFDPGAVPAGAVVALYKTNAQNQWEKVVNATFGASSVSGQVTSFSHGQAVTEDLLGAAVKRTWTFSDMINVGFGLDGGQQLITADTGEDFGGDSVEVHDFGPAHFDSGFALFDGTQVVRNDIANGVAASGADGKTLQVAAEAPIGNASIPGEIVGSSSHLVQQQTFLKVEEDATLAFTMPLVRIETHDENAVLGRTCPEEIIFCNFIQGYLKFEVEAFSEEPPPGFLPDEVFRIVGVATLRGFAENWRVTAVSGIDSGAPFWNVGDFSLAIEDLNGASDSSAVLSLRTPHSFNVDLSSIEVGKTFHLKITATAAAFNRLAAAPSERPTSAGAYINFEPPLGAGGGGGAMVTFNGLEQIDTPEAPLPDPPPLPQPPLPCVGGSNSAAGVLQFSAATYSSPETDTTPTVTVTRTGGSSGAVSATFTTIGGTATADGDFEPVNTRVLFADGDTEPRVAEIPILEDSIAEGNETVEFELSQPGGCAQIGAQDTAILTIIDDDAAPPPSGLDASFGGDGKATLEAFGGDRSGMAVQSDGKVIMVGGTFTDFVMARFNANGSIDDDFGDDGKVTTNMVSNEQAEALAVVIQPDDKILVVGYTGQAVGPSVFALARYKADGSPDDTFGQSGKSFGSVVGRAFAVKLLPDGSILVAGDEPANEDFVLARFSANGVLDGSFGNSGFVVTDIGGGADLGGNIVLQSTGAIVISGPHTKPGESIRGQHTGLVRFTANGGLDGSFGTGGKLLLENASVGEGLAAQGDNKLVLAGKIETAVFPATRTRFALMRLDANGAVDNSFGTSGNGKVETAMSERGDVALAVALQTDGKIVAAGSSSGQTNPNFAVARYDRNGVLDTSFGVGGKIIADFFGFTDVAENVAIQSNGKIVLGGLSRNNVDGYGVARVLP